MSNKIPNEYNRLILEGYEELLQKGYPKTAIADILNEKWGTDFPESSMRGRYDKEKIAGSNGMDDYEYQTKLFNVAKQDLRLKEQRKVLVKQRGMVDAIVKEYSEKQAVQSVIENVWKQTYTHNEDLMLTVKPFNPIVPIYGFADVHFGYNFTSPLVTYNHEVARRRLKEVFDGIITDAKLNGYREIYIADLGDQIEGAGLRISQLLRITEAMTEQAKLYANEIISLLKMTARELPEVSITFCMVSEDNHAQLRLYNTKRDEMPENLASLITNTVATAVETAHEFGGMTNITFNHADEILLSLRQSDGVPYNVVMAHGHQYGRNEDILDKTERRHQTGIHLFLAGHWHQFSVKYKNVKDGGQQALIFLPSVVGDTDFSDKLFLSCYPGFIKATVDLKSRMTNAQFIRLEG